LIGDFNGDGKDDIVNLQADGTSNNWVALSNGDGTFNIKGASAGVGLSRGFWGDENNSEQLIGDFNGDGKDDIVNLQSDGTSNNWVALSNGDGTFNVGGASAAVGLGLGFWNSENNSKQLIGDFNGDGFDDISNVQSDGLNWIAYSNGDGTFRLQRDSTLNRGYISNKNQSRQLVGDFSGDGKSDIVNLQYDGTSNNWLAFSGVASDQGNILSGDAGNDQIFGVDGNDQITGGSGNDSLSGGSGSDTYFYNIGDGRDVISDNDSSSSKATAIDIIKLSGVAKDNLIFAKSSNGNDLAILFKNNFHVIIETLRSNITIALAFHDSRIHYFSRHRIKLERVLTFFPIRKYISALNISVG
jgi:Ca2+-binding RTX toxin-like protein